jgi:hypothetical protein
MKPAWDKLTKEFQSDQHRLIAEVDCTGAGEELCEAVGIESYPTIKYGDPNNLKDYEGEREFDDLKDFALENLGPVCDVAHFELCNHDNKVLIAKFMAMSAEQLQREVDEKEGEFNKLEKDLEEFLEGLQAQYEEAMAKKNLKQKAIKASGLRLMRAVREHKGAWNEL